MTRPRAAAAADTEACCRPAGYAPRRTQTARGHQSSGSGVLVDQPAEHVPAADLRRGRPAHLLQRSAWSGKRQRRLVESHSSSIGASLAAAPDGTSQETHSPLSRGPLSGDRRGRSYAARRPRTNAARPPLEQAHSTRAGRQPAPTARSVQGVEGERDPLVGLQRPPLVVGGRERRLVELCADERDGLISLPLSP